MRSSDWSSDVCSSDLLFFGEKIGTRRSLALLAGFAGVVVLASSKIAGASIGWAVMAGATASFLFGIGINLVRRHMTGLPPAEAAAATPGTSALLLLPFDFASLPDDATPIQSARRTIVEGKRCWYV